MKKVLSVAFLLLLSAFVYRDWFTFKLFSYGDYVYYTKNALASYFPFSVWVGNFDVGGFDVLFWRLPQYILFAVGARSGLEFNVLDRFIIFWPWVVLSVVPMYFLLNTLVKNELAKILGVMVFAFNTYFLSISTQGHLLISVASCFSIATFALFKRFVDTKESVLLPLISILLLMVTIYDLRIAYITFWLIAAFLGYKFWVDKDARKSWVKIIFGFFTILAFYVGLNLYWVIPTIFSGGAVSQNILERSLFGNEFLNILYSYSLFHPFWTGFEPSWFEIQKINPLSWVLPIFALIGFMYGRKNMFIVFVGLIAALGIFLTKQASIPLSGAYEFLFNYLPGFSAFREASKFYYLVAFSYALLIAFAIDKFASKKGNYKVFSVVIVVVTSAVLIWNIKPVVTGEIGSLFIEREIPDDYKKFNEFVESQDSYFRVVWVPRPSRWLDATNKNPQVSLLDFLNKDWKDFRPKKFLELYEHGKAAEADIGLAFLRDPKAEELLASISAKYIVMPISDEKNADNVYQFLGRNSGEVYDSLKQIPYLKEIKIDGSQLRVFELETYSNIIVGFENSTEIEVVSKMVSPSHYEVQIQDVSDDINIYFSNKYDEKWMLLAGEMDPMELLLNEVEYIKPEKTNANTNKYYINVEKFCQDNAACKKDPSGKYSINLTLFYKPQAYFFLGSIISIIVIAIAGFGVFLFLIKFWYEKKAS